MLGQPFLGHSSGQGLLTMNAEPGDQPNVHDTVRAFTITPRGPFILAGSFFRKQTEHTLNAETRSFGGECMNGRCGDL